jgi:hypothetical protein
VESRPIGGITAMEVDARREGVFVVAEGLAGAKWNMIGHIVQSLLIDFKP